MPCSTWSWIFCWCLIPAAHNVQHANTACNSCWAMWISFIAHVSFLDACFVRVGSNIYSIRIQRLYVHNTASFHLSCKLPLLFWKVDNMFYRTFPGWCVSEGCLHEDMSKASVIIDCLCGCACRRSLRLGQAGNYGDAAHLLLCHTGGCSARPWRVLLAQW